MAFVIKIKNRLQEPAVKKCDCSKKIITTYDLERDTKGLIKIVKTGEVNIYEKIQTYVSDCDFNKILNTIKITGDFSMYADKRPDDMITDLTIFPSSLGEAKELLDNSDFLKERIKRSEFYKSKGLSFEEFVKSYDSLEHGKFLKEKFLARKKEVEQKEANK